MGRLLLLALAALAISTASAHPGRRDSNGGHMDRSTGIYHCHRDDCVLPTPPPVVDEDEDDSGEVSDEPAPDEDAPPAIMLAGSWGTAKRWARDIVYEDENETFYCACTYTASGNAGGGSVDHADCGYDGSNEPNAARATVLEWEHVVPASLMPARQFACWNEGLPECSEPGRACCERHDLNARAQIFDLHNLVPSVGQANALHADKRYGLVDGEERKLGMCDFEWTSITTEPADSRRGDVARIWLYFVEQHGLQLAPGELRMFLEWSQQDPPDSFERTRNERIKAQQGNGNPFVEGALPP